MSRISGCCRLSLKCIGTSTSVNKLSLALRFLAAFSCVPPDPINEGSKVIMEVFDEDSGRWRTRQGTGPPRFTAAIYS